MEALRTERDQRGTESDLTPKGGKNTQRERPDRGRSAGLVTSFVHQSRVPSFPRGGGGVAGFNKQKMRAGIVAIPDRAKGND